MPGYHQLRDRLSAGLRTPHPNFKMTLFSFATQMLLGSLTRREARVLPGRVSAMVHAHGPAQPGTASPTPRTGRTAAKSKLDVGAPGSRRVLTGWLRARGRLQHAPV